jgi:hypothetical protein
MTQAKTMMAPAIQFDGGGSQWPSTIPLNVIGITRSSERRILLTLTGVWQLGQTIESFQREMVG